MSTDRLVVLKFGGSVLRDETSLWLAVHEVYRWRREGYRIVAVISALGGTTDRLMSQCHRSWDGCAAESVAAYVSSGEWKSAALLGLHLDRAGIAARVLSPAALQFVASGHPLDATPVDVNETPIYQTLHHEGVLVVPGYVAQDQEGRTVVLGRGGSDLTALFLAHRLYADCCRLIKDVDGLYESDPAASGRAPRRYRYANWEDALATDGSIVQHKSVRFARSHGLEFELGCFNGTAPTRIGEGETVWGTEYNQPTPLRVALLGLGTVGMGVYELLQQLPSFIEVVRVAVHDAHKKRELHIPADLLTVDAQVAASCGADVVIEVMGGVVAARAAVESALRAGAHVVTANKALLAEEGQRLGEIAASGRQMLCFSASVGGSMPLLERIRRPGAADIRSIRAVINSTTNYILDRVAGGAAFDEAVRCAQRQGLAERDPSRDLLGLDAADKLCVMAQLLGQPHVTPAQIVREELSAAIVVAALASRKNGGFVRHIATLSLSCVDRIAHVQLQELPPDDPLATTRGEHNRAVIDINGGPSEVLQGKGAGRWPTAVSVLADVLEIVRRVSQGSL